jgi:hypothetical protein
LGGRWGIFLSLLLTLVTLAACAGNNSSLSTATSPRFPDLTGPNLTGPNLTGMNPIQVVALYGQPDFRRADPPAEIWQYRSKDCVLELYFYSGAGGEQLAFAQSRPRNLAQNVAAGHCSGGTAALDARTKESKL